MNVPTHELRWRRYGNRILPVLPEYHAPGTCMPHGIMMPCFVCRPLPLRELQAKATAQRAELRDQADEECGIRIRNSLVLGDLESGQYTCHRALGHEGPHRSGGTFWG